MIVNLTEKFLELKHVKKVSNSATLNCDELTKKITHLSKEILTYKHSLRKNRLPSFKPNFENNLQAEKIKTQIENLAKSIKEEIFEISFVIKHRIVQENFVNFYTKKLETEIVNFKKIIADDIHHTSSYDILSEVVNENAVQNYNMYEFQQEQKTKNSNSLITNTLVSLTNTLLEIKMNLKEQSIAIDSLDRYFENTNRYLDMANDEIRKLPHSMFGLKDKIIKVLLLCSFVLGIAIICKGRHFELNTITQNNFLHGIFLKIRKTIKNRAKELPNRETTQ
ncbi:hypothetical protein EHP00_253 [Ecytonucleospora hepatopenaei]|uniref:t-SNARE coiled-coil homology domain-containing protein n=1 Tax=Ecytonucleospora hepatopenaei TaxID=646526 RepID=A0A1W0E6L7_9MICR|nr:hypothetical protein EHP00_253 [Ecytonucleospora hepatopenaei]